MKSTFEIPDVLFREAKTFAAQRNKKMKDLVARGLELALAEEKKSYAADTPLQTIRMIRENPLHSSEEIEAWMKQVDKARKEGWEYPGEKK